VRRLGLLALTVLGCIQGQGSGEARGPLTILDCGGTGKNFPPPSTPGAEFDLHPQFFGAEQLLDLTNGQTKQNRLIIRLQNTGRRREVSDILRFDITNLFEVARCVRGGTTPDGGADDFDHRDCARSPTGVRIRVGPNALVRAFLTPNFSCSTKVQIYDHVGAANSMPHIPNDGNWDSYIVFATLGRAALPSFSPDFKIELDDPLDASDFQLTILDDAVVTALTDPRMPPVPDPRISGKLHGNFHFTMQRGQGAQTFP
jgi:hypothetical protein